MKKTKKIKKKTLIIILVALIVLLTALVSFHFIQKNSGGDFTPKEKELPEDVDKFNSIAENILQAFNNNDYSKFSEDFSEKVKNLMNEQSFQETKTLLDETSGKYISKSEPTLVAYQEYKAFQYPCVFEKENVTLTLYFTQDSYKIEGLTFDSENLREVIE